jgi:hypothetical protein
MPTAPGLCGLSFTQHSSQNGSSLHWTQVYVGLFSPQTQQGSVKEVLLLSVNLGVGGKSFKGTAIEGVATDSTVLSFLLELLLAFLSTLKSAKDRAGGEEPIARGGEGFRRE